MEPLSYLALNGSLGTGFREESLEAGLARPLAFIGVDSGSTDGGPVLPRLGRVDLVDGGLRARPPARAARAPTGSASP